jgi:hypothetical protein
MGLQQEQTPAHDAYDLDAEFGPRRKTPVAQMKQRRNTTGTLDNATAHASYLAPKYAGPGLSYRRAPFKDVNTSAHAQETSPPKKSKAVAAKNSFRAVANRRQSMPAKKVTERKRSVAECRTRRTIKKPVRYIDEFADPPSSVASTRKSKRTSKGDDSGLAITIASDSEQSVLGESVAQWLARDKQKKVKPSPSVQTARSKQNEIKLWLDGGSGPPKPADEESIGNSIDSMSIRGGGVTSSEDEVPIQAVVRSSPKATQVKKVANQVAATSKTLEMKRPQELGAEALNFPSSAKFLNSFSLSVPINALASQMVTACGAELKNLWQSFASRDEEMLSEFVDLTQTAMEEITENDRKIKMSEKLIAKLRSAMMTQMETIEKINAENNAL